MRVYVVNNSASYPEDRCTYGYFSTRKRANSVAKFLNASEEVAHFDKPIKVGSIRVDSVDRWLRRIGYSA